MPNRDYSNWACASCVAKNMWGSTDYRENRPLKRIKQRSKANSTEHRAKISKALTGRKLSDSHKSSISESSKNLWRDQEYRASIVNSLQSEEKRKLRSIKSADLWKDPSFKSKYQTSEFREKSRAVTTALWKNADFRNKIISSKNTIEHKDLMRKIQSDPEYIRKLSAAYLKLPKVSSLQKILYTMLDSLGVKYFCEINNPDKCLIGPWSFDCVIPLPETTLLIECQGDWVHSLPHKKAADKAKETYISSYFKRSHTLKYIWEHQFASYNAVYEMLKRWCGIPSDEQHDFEFEDILIKPCKAVDYRLFLQSYHYLSNAGRGGIAYGAYLKQKLIAICVFSPLPRQNIKVGDYHNSQIKDLSRFCIHPNYQKKNLASWFISRCINSFNENIRAIISYADSTFNHHGGIYKACNFKFDGYVTNDYWYASPDGWVMHKKTLYNKATNLKMTEAEYAQKYGFFKVYGGKKLRYLYIR